MIHEKRFSMSLPSLISISNICFLLLYEIYFFFSFSSLLITFYSSYLFSFLLFSFIFFCSLFFALVIMSYSSYLVPPVLFYSPLFSKFFFFYSILFTRLFSFFSFFTLISHFLFFHYTVCCWATKTFGHDNYSFCNACQSWFSKSTVGKDNNVSTVQCSAVQCIAPQ